MTQAPDNDRAALTPYLRALLCTTHLGSLLTLSQLLQGEPLAFLAPLVAGAASWLAAPLFADLHCRGEAPALRRRAVVCALLSLAHAAVILVVTALNLKATFLHRTPLWVLLPLLLAVPVTALFRTDGALMRLSRLIFPVTLLMLLTVVLIQTQWKELINILAALPFDRMDAVPRSVLLTLALVYANPAVATPLLFSEVDGAVWVRAQRQGTLLSALLLSLMLLLPVTTLGLPLFEQLRCPLYSAGNAIVYGTPLIRVDTLLSTVSLFAVLTDLCMTAQTVRLVLRTTGVWTLPQS